MESQTHFQAELESIDHWLAGYQSKEPALSWKDLCLTPASPKHSLGFLKPADYPNFEEDIANTSFTFKHVPTLTLLQGGIAFASLGLQPTRLLHPWDFPGKCTGVGCRCLLREQ